MLSLQSSATLLQGLLVCFLQYESSGFVFAEDVNVNSNYADLLLSECVDYMEHEQKSTPTFEYTRNLIVNGVSVRNATASQVSAMKERYFDHTVVVQGKERVYGGDKIEDSYFSFHFDYFISKYLVMDVLPMHGMQLIPSALFYVDEQQLKDRDSSFLLDLYHTSMSPYPILARLAKFHRSPLHTLLGAFSFLHDQGYQAASIAIAELTLLGVTDMGGFHCNSEKQGCLEVQPECGQPEHNWYHERSLTVSKQTSLKLSTFVIPQFNHDFTYIPSFSGCPGPKTPRNLRFTPPNYVYFSSFGWNAQQQSATASIKVYPTGVWFIDQFISYLYTTVHGITRRLSSYYSLLFKYIPDLRELDTSTLSMKIDTSTTYNKVYTGYLPNTPMESLFSTMIAHKTTELLEFHPNFELSHSYLKYLSDNGDSTAMVYNSLLHELGLLRNVSSSHMYEEPSVSSISGNEDVKTLRTNAEKLRKDGITTANEMIKTTGLSDSNPVTKKVIEVSIPRTTQGPHAPQVSNYDKQILDVLASPPTGDHGKGQALQTAAAMQGNLEANFILAYRHLSGTSTLSRCNAAAASYAEIAQKQLKSRSYTYFGDASLRNTEYNERLDTTLWTPYKHQRMYSSDPPRDIRPFFKYHVQQLMSTGEQQSLQNSATVLYFGAWGVMQDQAVALQLWNTSAEEGNAASSAMLLQHALHHKLPLQGKLIRNLLIHAPMEVAHALVPPQHPMYVYRSQRPEEADDIVQEKALELIFDFDFLTEISNSIMDEPQFGTNPEFQQAVHVQRIKSFAKTKSAVAVFTLGYLYLKGIGLSKSESLAHTYLLAAAEMGHIPAIYHLGVMSLNSQNPKIKNYGNAVQLLSKASNAGHHKAMYNLAQMYMHGIGQPQSCDLAVRLFKNVAELEYLSVNKQYKVANGLARTANMRSSAVSYMILAEMGFETAQHNAAFLLYPRAFASKTEGIHIGRTRTGKMFKEYLQYKMNHIDGAPNRSGNERDDSVYMELHIENPEDMFGWLSGYIPAFLRTSITTVVSDASLYFSAFFLGGARQPLSLMTQLQVLVQSSINVLAPVTDRPLQNLHLLMRYLRFSSEQGNVVSIRRLGDLELFGVSGRSDPAVALQMYSQAAKLGDVESAAIVTRLALLGLTRPVTTTYGEYCANIEYYNENYFHQVAAENNMNILKSIITGTSFTLPTNKTTPASPLPIYFPDIPITDLPGDCSEFLLAKNNAAPNEWNFLVKDGFGSFGDLAKKQVLVPRIDYSDAVGAIKNMKGILWAVHSLGVIFMNLRRNFDSFILSTFYKDVQTYTALNGELVHVDLITHIFDSPTNVFSYFLKPKVYQDTYRILDVEKMEKQLEAEKKLKEQQQLAEKVQKRKESLEKMKLQEKMKQDANQDSNGNAVPSSSFELSPFMQNILFASGAGLIAFIVLVFNNVVIVY